jgi:predicted ATP-binding protein involved in virulence
MQKIHEQLYQILRIYRKEVSRNLLYTYRRNNINGYLDKGFYFQGDESVILLSFWSGVNVDTKYPYINIAIYDSGNIFLEVTLDKFIKDESFISQYILPLFAFEENSSINGLYQLYLGELSNLEKIISDFIEKEKIIIDKVVLENEKNFRFALGKTTRVLLGFIDPKNFDAEDRIISRHRRNFFKAQEFERTQSSKVKPAHIQSFHVNNFSVLKNIEFTNVPQGNRWIFLTGENGSGKTLILRALAFVISQVIIPNRYSPKRNDNPVFHLKLRYQSGDIIEYNRIGNNDDSKYSHTPCVTGFAAYGIFRQELNRNNEVIDLSKNESLNSIMYDDKVAPLLNFNKVLEEWDKDEKKREQFEQRRSYIINALIEIVPGLVDIHFENVKNKIKAKYFIKNEFEISKLDYYQLSSGTRSILSLVVDIFIRFYNQQQKINDPSQLTGIVLIDEIDLHLHPIGQRDLVANLSKLFPNIQFIVSTHSPIPILGAPEKSVIITVKKEAEKGIYVERWDDKIPLKKLLPNAILTSPIFDLEDILPKNEYLSEIRTEDNFDEAFFNYMLQKKIDELKKKSE